MAEKKSKKSIGHSLWVYLLPVVVAGVVLISGIGIYAQHAISSKIGKQNKSSMSGAANGLVERLEAMVDSRREINQVLTRIDGLAGVMVTTVDAERKQQTFAAYLESLVSDIQHIQLIAVGQERAAMSKQDNKMSYAGLDLIRRAIEEGKTPLTEVHRLGTSSPYIAIASPIKRNDRAVGVLLSGYPLDIVKKQVDAVIRYPGWVQVVQGDGEESVTLAQSTYAESGQHEEEIHVPGTLMRVRYKTISTIGILGAAPVVIAIVASAVVLLILIGFLQYKLLSSDLREDMGSVLSLVDALLKRTGTPQPKPKLTDAAPTILLLGRYAQTVYSNTTQKEGHEKQQGATGAKPSAQVFGDVLPAPVDSVDVAEIPEHIFRAYDIRGVVGETLTREMAQLLGMAIGSLAQEQGQKLIYVGRDARLSSPELAENLIDGILGTGCDVGDLGQVVTPATYFATHIGNSQSAVMVTGSHNAKEYNGFKIVVNGTAVAEQELKALHQRVVNGEFEVGKGQRETLDIAPQYLEELMADVQLERSLKVVVDAGNGIAGPLAVQSLKAIGCEVVELYCEPDGNFPNHHPDPSKPENMLELMEQVKQQSADLGLAFDGDGDRVGLVDDQGQLLNTDLVMMLLADNILTSHPGVDIIYDVKSSRHLASFILSHGGRPIMWKTGHTRIKAKMKETGALLGGEFSGHICIKERWYGFDDAIYTAARIIEILAAEATSSSEIFARLPRSVSSPEYQMLLPEGENFTVMPQIIANAVFDNASIIDLDGLRVEFTNSWGLVRPSNTTPALVFRFEGDNEAALKSVEDKFRTLITSVIPNASLPF